MALGGAATDDNQVRFRLLRKATQNLGNVAAGNNYLRVDPSLFAELGHLLRSSSHERFFQIGLYIFPSRPIYLEAGNDVAEGEPGPEFGGQADSPTHGVCAMRTEIDRTKNVANVISTCCRGCFGMATCLLSTVLLYPIRFWGRCDLGHFPPVPKGRPVDDCEPRHLLA